MSLTGGISFFDRNLALFSDGATCAASSNTDDQNLVLGTNKYFRWQSSGSDDTTTETLTITLSSAQAISRIFLADHNFKEFTIKYGAGPSDFTNVTGIDGDKVGGIAETAYARDTAYYEFDEVTTDTIVITATKTQTADQEKSLVQLIATTELGTLTGYPELSSVTLDRDDKKERAVSGKHHIQKGYESAGFDLSLRSYPNQADVDLLDSLHDRDRAFMVWLSGGLPDQFHIEQRGFRLKDIYLMKVDQAMRNGFPGNIYVLGANQRYSFLEVVE